jgi:hypothetical protein
MTLPMTLPTTAARGLTAVLTLASAGGCLVGFVDDVPCATDDACATGDHCDLTVGACAPGDAPDVRVVEIVDDGVAVIDPFVPPDVPSTLAMRVTNPGGAPAEDIALRMGELACLGLVVDAATVPATLAPGAIVDVAFTVTPRLCSTPAIQDWFFEFSGRGSRGTFNIVIERAPPSGD